MAAPSPAMTDARGARFLRSANLEADYGSAESLNDYIVSALAAETTTRITRDLTTQGARAWFLVGPYGSGKSSFLTFFASFISAGSVGDTARTMMSRQQPAAGVAAIQHQAELSAMLPVVLTGQRGPMGPELLRAARVAGERVWDRGGAPPVHDQIRQLLTRRDERIDGGEVVRLLLAFADAVVERSPARGVVVMVDEMGKFLEHAAQEPKSTDIYLLQQLAEAASRAPDARLSVLTVLHQDFEEYAHRLPTGAQAEWSKVRGRFETITFLESPAHLLNLLARAIRHRAGPRQGSLVPPKRAVDEAEELSALLHTKDASRATILRDCYPLNAVSALAVGPLFRLRLGQNERSLFSFLASNEPGGFQSHLAQHEGAADVPPYTLDRLYDYVVENTHARAGGAGRARVWAAADEAQHRLPANAKALESRLIKAVAVLTALGEGVGLPVSKRALGLALSLTTPEQQRSVDAAVDRLVSSSILVFRRFRQSYQIWDGSDLDVEELVREARSSLIRAGGFAAKVQELVPPFPVVAARHYHLTGTFRVMEARYVGASEAARPASQPCEGDGLLLMLLPDQATQVAEVEAKLSGVRTSQREAPRVVALPDRVDGLLDAVAEALGVQQVLTTTPDLDNDPIARRELEERLSHAVELLTSRLAESFGSDRQRAGARWLYRGEVRPLNGRPSAAASAIFDEVFSKAPRIVNELINRESLSSAAAAARHVLLRLMISAQGEPELGITGHPPELSLYRSVLQVTGIHRERDGRLCLGEPHEPTLKPVFAHIERTLAEAKGQQVSFADLLAGLQAPPYGVRAGVGLVLIFAWFVARQDELFLYEEGGLVPVVPEDLVQRLLRAPAMFTLQLPLPSAAASVAVARLIEKMQLKARDARGGGMFDVVRATIGIIRRLTPYAAQSQSLSGPTRRVRSEVTSAKDPVQLFVSKLPSALGFDSLDQPTMSDDDKAIQFADALYAALDELRRADRTLLERIERTLMELLRLDGRGREFYAALSERAARLENTPDLSPRVRRWVGFAASIDPDDVSSQHDFLRGVATIIRGKLPERWNDDDVLQFAQGAMELCRAYLAAEEMSLERRHHKPGSFRMIRVSVLNSEGEDRSAVAMLRSEDVKRVDAVVKQVRAEAAAANVAPRELAYAVIAEMMALLDEGEGQGGKS